jgi:hypothetical protein
MFPLKIGQFAMLFPMSQEKQTVGHGHSKES